MANLPDYHLETEFKIDPPTGRSKAFRLRYRSPDTNNLWVALNLPEIKLANDQFKSGVSAELTKAKLDLIRDAQYAHRDRKKVKPAFLPHNLQLVERYWEEIYTPRKLREMADPDQSRHELIKSATKCGIRPLDTCDLKELENHLFKTHPGKDNEAALRRCIIWVNALLKWLGRKPLSYLKEGKIKVRYLNEDEFNKVLKYITDDRLKRLMRIAFYTSMRKGEVFGVALSDIRDSFIEIERQMLRKPNPKVKGESRTYPEGPPKNGEPRTSFYPERVKEDLIGWASTTWESREPYRLARYSEPIRDACKLALGYEKITSFRDLRHCSAIWYLQQGATMAEVAQQIGDGIDVCYRHYTGFELKKESIDRFKRLVD